MLSYFPISTARSPGPSRKAATPAGSASSGSAAADGRFWEYAAHSGTLKAGVAFYGPPGDPPNPLWPKSPTQLAPEMKAPVLGLYGEADTGIPVATVEALKAALAEAKKTAEFKIYPGAPHGFHADYRASYRQEAAEDAWSQMQAWFKKYNVLG